MSEMENQMSQISNSIATRLEEKRYTPSRTISVSRSCSVDFGPTSPISSTIKPDGFVQSNSTLTLHDYCFFFCFHGSLLSH